MKTTLLFLSVFLSVSLLGQQMTYVPDDNFEQALIDLGYDDVLDDYILTSNVNTIEFLDLAIRNISDLTGIEDFIELSVLDCQSNHLTDLDLSQNTNLVEFQCFGNQIIELDISQNTNLIELYCSGNQLTSLDVSQNTDLVILHCAGNLITSMDISQNTDLTVLYAWGNWLTSLNTNGAESLRHLDCSFNLISRLDVSQNTNLFELDCQVNLLTCLNAANTNNANFNYFWVNGNSNLTCIEVDEVDYSSSYWTIEPQMSFSENCNNDCSLATAGINEITSSKNLIQILDLMGRETTFKPNTSLIYVYDDGSTEKVFRVEY